MRNYDSILQETAQRLAKALDHLAYSAEKVQKLPDDLALMDEEAMETWESFTSRFSRVSDIFIMQYLRTKLAIEEPGYKGTTRDYLNKAEKLGLIQSAREWTSIRELRNVEAHEYKDQDLTAFYRRLKSLYPTLLAIRHLLVE